MLSIQVIRDRADDVRRMLAERRTSAPLDEILAGDERRRALIVQVEHMRAQRNDASKAIGQAKREAVKSEHMLKHTKALAMKLYASLPVSAQEREALASDQYLMSLQEVADAAGDYEKLKALREAAALKIEAWRAASSNYRSMKI